MILYMNLITDAIVSYPQAYHEGHFFPHYVWITYQADFIVNFDLDGEYTCTRQQLVKILDGIFLLKATDDVQKKSSLSLIWEVYTLNKLLIIGGLILQAQGSMELQSLMLSKQLNVDPYIFFMNNSHKLIDRHKCLQAKIQTFFVKKCFKNQRLCTIFVLFPSMCQVECCIGIKQLLPV